MPSKQKILKAREAVDNYRVAHAALYVISSQQSSVSEAHTPLMEKMLADLKVQDFNSLEDFFTASEDLNIKELGFKDKDGLEAKVSELKDAAKVKVQSGLNTTFNLAHAAGACVGGYQKVAEALGGFNKYGRDTPVPLSKIVEICGLPTAVWLLKCTIEPVENPLAELTRKLAEMWH